MTKVLSLFAVGVFLFALAVTADLQAGGKRSDSEVKVAATAGKPDAAGNQKVTVSLNVNKGWHIYANPVGNDDFASAKTVVAIAGKASDVKVNYPPGKLNEDKLLVYQDKVDIEASVKRAAGDTSPLEVSVRFMACKDGKGGFCLLPATVKLMVP